MKYTYKIEFAPLSGELFLPDADAVYDWKEEGRYNGFMRKHIQALTITKDYDDDGTLINTSIFNTLWEWYFDSTKQDSPLRIKIYKDAVLDYTGIFYVGDGDIDVNNGTYTITPTVDDLYREFLQVVDDEVDIIDPTEPYTAKLTYETVPETYTPSPGDPLPAPSGTWEETTVIGTYGRQKSLYDDGSAFTEYYQNHYYFKEWNFGDAPTTLEFEFPNCALLVDKIQVLLNLMLVDTSLYPMTFSSAFFSYATNYVTGEANKLMNTLIEQKSDTKDPDATNKAWIGKISWNQLMSDLKAMFDVRWFIDSSGDVRIEHERFFYQGASIFGSKSVGINLNDSSKYTDATGDKLYIEDTQMYNKSDIKPIKSETIKFLEEEGLDWRGDLFFIYYDVISDEAVRVDHTVSLMSTDLTAAINNPDDLQDNGFFLFNCEALVGSESAIISKEEDYTVPTTSDNVGNAGFSVKWLLHDYYEYNRSNANGLLNLPAWSPTADVYAVLATSPKYLQKDIVFLLNNADNIDINKYIATTLIKSDYTENVQKGTIIKISHDLYDDFVTVTLGFEL